MQWDIANSGNNSEDKDQAIKVRKLHGGMAGLVGDSKASENSSTGENSKPEQQAQAITGAMDECRWRPGLR